MLHDIVHISVRLGVPRDYGDVPPRLWTFSEETPPAECSAGTRSTRAFIRHIRLSTEPRPFARFPRLFLILIIKTIKETNTL